MACHVLENLLLRHGKPDQVRSNNGPELINKALQQWSLKHSVTLVYIQPGKPTQNAYVERLNGSLRREFLDVHIFSSVEHARRLAEVWQWDQL